MIESPRRASPILFVHHGQQWIRGSERCLLDIIEHLDRTQFRPVVWCDSSTLAREAAALDAVVHCAPTTDPTARYPTVAGVLARTAARLVRQHGIRVIHANDVTPFPALIPSARRHAIPLIVHLHLIPTAAERRWSLLHQASAVVGVSRASVAGLLDDGMRPDRVRVVYNGVDVERLTQGPPCELRAELGIPPAALTLTTVASLIDRKGIDVVIRALATLRSDGVDVHLLVCGDGEGEGHLRALAAELGVGRFTHFVGVRGDVGSVLRDATDVLVSAARLEAFPLNVLEAGACGVPVVASDIEPHREGIIDGVTGLIAAVDDPAAFARAIGRLAHDPALRRAIGRQAAEHVTRNYSMAQWLAGMHDVYRTVDGMPRRSLGWIGGSTFPAIYASWVRDAVGRRLRPLR